jgi:hypothetical protein
MSIMYDADTVNTVHFELLVLCTIEQLSDAMYAKQRC